MNTEPPSSLQNVPVCLVNGMEVQKNILRSFVEKSS